jgi:hypothetical protein
LSLCVATWETLRDGTRSRCTGRRWATSSVLTMRLRSVARWGRAGAPMVLSGLSGCVRGAPSFPLFGAFFPAWLFCAVFGVLAGVGARVAFLALGKADVLPYPLFVCTSIGVTCALLIWLVWFGR